jgi:hypothetical protein
VISGKWQKDNTRVLKILKDKIVFWIFGELSLSGTIRFIVWLGLN